MEAADAASFGLQRLVISTRFKSLMIWGRISADGRGSLQIWKVNTNAESIYRFYSKIHMFRSRRRLLLSGRIWVQKPAWSPELSPNDQTVGASMRWNEKYSKDDSWLLSSWSPTAYQAGMGQDFSPKTKATGLCLWHHLQHKPHLKSGIFRFRPLSYIEILWIWIRYLSMRPESKQTDGIFPGTASHTSLKMHKI